MEIEDRRRASRCPCGQEAEGFDLHPEDTGVEGVILTFFQRPENCSCEVPFLHVTNIEYH